MSPPWSHSLAALAALAGACTIDSQSAGELLSTSTTGGSGSPSVPSTGATDVTSSALGTTAALGTTTALGTTDALDGSVTDGAVIFDVAQAPDVGPIGDRCEVGADGAGVGPCQTKAPPDSFTPDVQWTWDNDLFIRSGLTIPLVGNLTDDDGNGTIDLCDTPDVVVMAVTGYDSVIEGRLAVLSGDDGSEHFIIDLVLDAMITPAIGDIDGDGRMEIIAVSADSRLVAFEHDGTLKWQSPGGRVDSVDAYAIALADLDADGRVEIMAGSIVFDDTGSEQWNVDFDIYLPGARGLVTAADLDADGDLEVIYGAEAYHHDGTPYYLTDLESGFPHVANFDDDADPEIIVTNTNGISLLEHDGTVTWRELRPTGDPIESFESWTRPAVVHDFDGDGEAELASAATFNYAVYDVGPEGLGTVWQSPIEDVSGLAGATAFDFDGDGWAEATYADESRLFVFDSSGSPLLVAPRFSGTVVEYPVVADIDNDGSAEILVVSNIIGTDVTEPLYPTLQAFRDVDDRWIQARRIWNQHTYHVSNVREDGTIPTVEPRSWEQLNTFRTNAQIEGGTICQPDPAG